MVVKKPQPLAQTCQSTPAFVESLATAAFRFTVVFGCTCAGRVGTKLTDNVVSGEIVIALEEALMLEFTTEVATSVTEVPVVVTGGAV